MISFGKYCRMAAAAGAFIGLAAPAWAQGGGSTPLPGSAGSITQQELEQPHNPTPRGPRPKPHRPRLAPKQPTTGAGQQPGAQPGTMGH